MSAITATGASFPRVFSFPRPAFAHVSWQSRIVIVQRPDIVAAHVRALIGGEPFGAGDSDLTFRATRELWNRRFTVVYSVHAVHCGTEVMASVHCMNSGRLDPVAAIAIRTISQDMGTILLEMRDDLQ